MDHSDKSEDHSFTDSKSKSSSKAAKKGPGIPKLDIDGINGPESSRKGATDRREKKEKERAAKIEQENKEHAAQGELKKKIAASR